MASDRIWGNRKEKIVIIDSNALMMLFEFSVNLDEELIDLIRFQRAFESSSRVVATMNEVIEVIINRMQ